MFNTDVVGNEETPDILFREVFRLRELDLSVRIQGAGQIGDVIPVGLFFHCCSAAEDKVPHGSQNSQAGGVGYPGRNALDHRRLHFPGGNGLEPLFQMLEISFGGGYVVVSCHNCLL